jgi:hypothetical protein
MHKRKFGSSPPMRGTRLVFIDETGTSTNMTRLRGRSLGQRKPTLQAPGFEHRRPPVFPRLRSFKTRRSSQYQRIVQVPANDL